MDILVKPIVTEKLTVQGEKLNRYGFRSTKGPINFKLKKQ